MSDTLAFWLTMASVVVAFVLALLVLVAELRPWKGGRGCPRGDLGAREEEAMSKSNLMQAAPVSWLWRLFPQQPFPRFPDYGFTLRTENIVRLDWKDRLRILLSGWCVVKVQIITDVQVRKAASESTFAVLPFGGPRAR